MNQRGFVSQLVETQIFNPRTKLVELVHKWGNVNTDGLLEKTTQVFEVEGIDGFIGYKVVENNYVVFGDPVSSENDKGRLALAFKSLAKKREWALFIRSFQTLSLNGRMKI